MTQVIPQEQMAAQLLTRNFEEGGFQKTPLQEFKATLSSITGEVVEPKPGQTFKAFTNVNYNFQEGDLQVLRTKEPYQLPVAQITIPHSTRKGSAMFYFGQSVDRIINAGVPADASPDQVKGQTYLTGKVLHMSLTPGHMMSVRQKDGTYVDQPQEAWELISIDGEAPAVAAPISTPVATGATVPPASAMSPVKQALNLLNGKTMTEWFQYVFKDPIVKSDFNLTNSIINKQFLPAMEAGGAAKAGPDGRYTVDLSKVK